MKRGLNKRGWVEGRFEITAKSLTPQGVVFRLKNQTGEVLERALLDTGAARWLGLGVGDVFDGIFGPSKMISAVDGGICCVSNIRRASGSSTGVV